MNKFLLPALGLLMTGACAHAAVTECAAPVFPAQSASTEGVRRVEKQVSQWRECQAARAAAQDPAESARQINEVDSAMQKWANATRLYSNGQVSGRQAQASIERDQREHLVSRLAPMPPVYGSERK